MWTYMLYMIPFSFLWDVKVSLMETQPDPVGRPLEKEDRVGHIELYIYCTTTLSFVKDR